VQVTVQVSPRAAKGLRDPASATPEAEELRGRVEQLGLSLQEMHPGTEDPALAEFLIIEVPDPQTGERVATALRDCPGVEAAYMKPSDELP
jgi:hypothetical protein